LQLQAHSRSGGYSTAGRHGITDRVVERLFKNGSGECERVEFAVFAGRIHVRRQIIHKIGIDRLPEMAFA